MDNRNTSIKKVNKSIINIKRKGSLNKIVDKCSLEKINSKFVIDKIFLYVAESCIKYKFELIKYSKLLQQQVDIDLNDYKFIYLTNKFNINRYSTLDYDNEKFDKNYLKNQVEKILKLKGLNFSITEIVDIIKKFNDKNLKNEKRNELDTFLFHKKLWIDGECNMPLHKKSIN